MLAILLGLAPLLQGRPLDETDCIPKGQDLWTTVWTHP